MASTTLADSPRQGATDSRVSGAPARYPLAAHAPRSLRPCRSLGKLTWRGGGPQTVAYGRTALRHFGRHVA
eukprot:4679494-Pyramimonas_sp.AAC.1